MIFENHQLTPERDLYRMHQAVAAWGDQGFNPLWGYRQGTILMRLRDRAPAGWTPVSVPPVGSRVAFRLMAVPVFKRNGVYIGEFRRERFFRSEDAALDWLRPRLEGPDGSRSGSAPMGAGLKILEADATLVALPIRKPRQAPFTKRGALFTGEAQVLDARLLTQALTRSIGDAGAFGFGFLFIDPISTH